MNPSSSPPTPEFSLEKENSIRKKILSIYNKPPQDFASLKDYNDYLEEVEDIIYNMVYRIDVEETQKRIREYENQNKAQIAVQRIKKAEMEQLKRQKEQQELAKAAASLYTSEQQRSNSSASAVATQNKGITDQKPTTVRSYAPVQGSSRATRVQLLVKNSPNPASYTNVSEDMLKKWARAGGYSNAIPFQRALDEAFGSLFAINFG